MGKTTSDTRRYEHQSLMAFAQRLFEAAGLPAARAESVARLLVLTDMMGRTTHGLAQCRPYLEDLKAGRMAAVVDPEVVVDRGSTIVWDGHYLPGLWLIESALQQAFERLDTSGVVTFAIRRSHHTGCLAALIKQAADRGCFAMLMSSGPHGRYVAPYGGTQALFSPNPYAIAFPAGDNPVLVDVSASITTASMVREKLRDGELFEHPWMLDADGKPSRDPACLEQRQPRGSLMLLGGVEAGHKGFGLALMVEALTQGLAGYGRKDAPTQWGASVFLQVIDPAAFAGRDAFEAQTAFLADACRRNPPAEASRPVRLPGDQAARQIASAQRDGVPLAASIVDSLRLASADLGVAAEFLDRDFS